MSVALKIAFQGYLRRVSVPSCFTLDNLKERLSQMFSEYSHSNRLRYIDAESDRITIETTEELQEAFRLYQGSVLRLFVLDEDSKDGQMWFEEAGVLRLYYEANANDAKKKLARICIPREKWFEEFQDLQNSTNANTNTNKTNEASSEQSSCLTEQMKQIEEKPEQVQSEWRQPNFILGVL